MRDGKFVSSHQKKNVFFLDFGKESSRASESAESDDKPMQKFFENLTFPGPY